MSVLSARNRSRPMAIRQGSIAPTDVISRRGLEVSRMNEIMYQTTMHIARNMLSEGLITEEDYSRFDVEMREKYKPTFGGIFGDIDLIYKK